MPDSEVELPLAAKTVVEIPASVVEQIYDTLLLEVFDVKAPYFYDALEMAQAAIFRMRENVAQVLDLMLEHCLALRLREEAKKDDLCNISA